jgi:hypothetical protein
MSNPAARHFSEYLAGVIFLVIALWLAGCVGTILTPASQLAAPLPGPGHVLVYDFLATLDET